MSLTAFLSGCLSLFDGVLSAVWEVPIFRFFLVALLFAAMVSLCVAVYRTSKGVAS